MRAMWIFVLVLFLDFNPASFAAEAKVLKVGGDYQVTEITKTPLGTFVIEFRHVKPTGKFDVLRLESDHVHLDVIKGRTLRLSAEVLETTKGVTEVSQVVLFFPDRRGPTPVWLISRKKPDLDLRAVRYLEMHAPLTDYDIL